LEGVSKKMISPAFHGREHLNVGKWMKGLKKQLPTTMMAFRFGFTGIHPYLANESRGDYQAAFDIENLAEIPLIKETIDDGLRLFQDYFGTSARYFVPPNGYFPEKAFRFLTDKNIEYFNTKKIVKIPEGNGKYTYDFRKLGQQSPHNLTYITRNANFEPSAIGRSNDWVDKCLNDIQIAFRWNKPAIISTHRVNYVGGIHPSNRRRGLKQLDLLLKKMLKKWPDIIFMSSMELGDLISNRTRGIK
jgi:hypothetical protein